MAIPENCQATIVSLCQEFVKFPFGLSLSANFSSKCREIFSTFRFQQQ